MKRAIIVVIILAAAGGAYYHYSEAAECRGCGGQCRPEAVSRLRVRRAVEAVQGGPGGGGGGFGGGGFGGPGGGGPRLPMTVELASVKRGTMSESISVVGNLLGALSVEAVP